MNTNRNRRGNVDVDTIISGIGITLVTLLGANIWLLLSVRDRIGKADKRIDLQVQRLSRIVEWVEGQGKRRRSA